MWSEFDGLKGAGGGVVGPVEVVELWSSETGIARGSRATYDVRANLAAGNLVVLDHVCEGGRKMEMLGCGGRINWVLLAANGVCECWSSSSAPMTDD